MASVELLNVHKRFAETPVERTEATLKAALSEVVDAQQEYFVRHTRYAASADDLPLRERSGVSVAVDSASELGYRASARAPALPTRICRVWYGGPGAPTGEEGMPRCEDAPRRAAGGR